MFKSDNVHQTFECYLVLFAFVYQKLIPQFQSIFFDLAKLYDGVHPKEANSPPIQVYTQNNSTVHGVNQTVDRLHNRWSCVMSMGILIPYPDFEQFHARACPAKNRWMSDG